MLEAAFLKIRAGKWASQFQPVAVPNQINGYVICIHTYIHTDRQTYIQTDRLTD